MKVRVYSDYSPIKIVNGEDLDKISTSAGLSGKYIEVDDSEIPKDRTHRNEWEYKDGKIKPNEVRVQEKLNKETQNIQKKQAVLEKLKISSAELSDILKV